MKILACLVSDVDNNMIAPFLEYMILYNKLDGETKEQEKQRTKQVAQIQDTIKFLWEHNGAMNLPPLV
ncbi:hypothetical protein BegalDRAFT_2533 [Beggiatoa alba B18LD]|uniref:Uncharacterized protein n=1 Tax=Beggiatoa alba B18LD TaxID=395493 RepID=I3CID3_9GAMM|nr:hypothetical protein [Beggiatoa alba]EIJ43376.1 hypothetical protein BegalDRAFT_2533 [Beggiatoa alba B18LD]